MREIIVGLSLWLVCAAASAQSLASFKYEETNQLDAWNRKVNVRVSATADSPKEGAAALRFEVQPGEFSFGWIHTKLPAIDFSKVAGVHGYYRTLEGGGGQLQGSIVLVPGNGQPQSYFSANIGAMMKSKGQWTEFYLPLKDFTPSSGPVSVLKPATLSPNDLFQFMAYIGNKKTVVDIDGVEFIDAAAAKDIAARAEAQKLRGLLKSPGEDPGAAHPRLLLTPDAVEKLRARAKQGGDYGVAWDTMVKKAEDYLKTYKADDPMKAVFEHAKANADTKIRGFAGYEGLLRNIVDPIEFMAGAYRLTGDERFGRHAAKALVNCARRFTVNDVFQDRGFYYTRTFYVRTLAFGYDWLFDLMTPAERADVQMTMIGYIRNIHDRSWKDGWGNHPLRRVWNWDPGLMGACGVAMLSLEGATNLPEEAIIFECRRHIRDYLTLGIGPDGSGNEGPNYLGYGSGAAVEFVEILRRKGLDDLFVGTNYELIAPWVVSEILPGGNRWNNLSDCGHGTRAWPVYIYAMGRLAALAADDPVKPGERWPAASTIQPYHYLAHFSEVPGSLRISYGAHASLMGWAWKNAIGGKSPSGYHIQSLLGYLIYFEPFAAVADPAEVLPLGMYFRGRGLVVCRTGFGPEDVYMAVEAGPYAAGHDQSDKGSFNLFGYGADLAIDSGYGNDGDPQKGGSAYAHNVVLIDGEGQPMSYHNQSSGYITGFHTGRVADWIRVDASDAWGIRYGRDYEHIETSPVKRADRGFLFVRPSGDVPAYVVVFDDIQKDEARHAYTWQWHIPSGMQFETDAAKWVSKWQESGIGVALGSDVDQKGGSATFNFTIETPGKYKIVGLSRAAGEDMGKSDSFFVSVDGGEDLTWDSSASRDFQWKDVANRGEAGARIFDLRAGQHKIMVKVRETQAELAKLRVQPEGGERAIAADGTMKGALLLDASEAVLGTPAMKRQAVTQDARAVATLDVFPVHPRGGRIEQAWFETTTEGSHPRLQYTVDAVNPYFVFVLAPRKPGVPEPKVSPLAGGARGAVVEWPGGVTDYVYFASDAKAAGDCPVGTDAAAALVRTSGGKVADWAAYDGTSLNYQAEQLLKETERGNRETTR